MRGANLCEVRLRFADLRGAKNLTENQVRETNNFKQAFLPEHLAHLEEDPPVA